MDFMLIMRGLGLPSMPCVRCLIVAVCVGCEDEGSGRVLNQESRSWFGEEQEEHILFGLVSDAVSSQTKDPNAVAQRLEHNY